MLTNYIIAIQYTRSYYYAITHQSDKIMHMSKFSVMLCDLGPTEQC